MTTSANDYDNGFNIVAAGHFNADAGAPGWTWQKGFTAVVTRNAAGNYALTLDRPLAGPDCHIHVSSAEAMVATRKTDFGVFHATDTVKTITTMREDGGAGGDPSIAADVDFQIVVFKNRAG
jgi:hypothetical protein